jgi:hypothetical protein
MSPRPSIIFIICESMSHLATIQRACRLQRVVKVIDESSHSRYLYLQSDPFLSWRNKKQRSLWPHKRSALSFWLLSKTAKYLMESLMFPSAMILNSTRRYAIWQNKDVIHWLFSQNSFDCWGCLFHQETVRQHRNHFLGKRKQANWALTGKIAHLRRAACSQTHILNIGNDQEYGYVVLRSCWKATRAWKNEKRAAKISSSRNVWVYHISSQYGCWIQQPEVCLELSERVIPKSSLLRSERNA